MFVINAVSKIFCPLFLRNFSMFCMYDFCFFVLFRRMPLCPGLLVVCSVSRMLKTEMYSCFLVFLICNLTFKNQDLVFLLRCSLHYVHILDILVYHSRFFLTPTCNFLPALVLFLNNFLSLNFILLLISFL